jgi:two-component system sensor histidine kinase DegS
MLTDPTADLAANLYVIIVEATVGFMAWIFVAAAIDMRDNALAAKEEAERLAAQAVAAHEEALTSRQQAISAKEEAQQLAAEVTRLNRMLLNAQDTERRRLAHDIHDGPLQALGVELLAMERVKRRLESGETGKASQELEFLGDIARQSITDLRNTVNALRNTLLDSGIEPALRNLARTTQESAGLQIEVTVSPDPDREQALSESLVNCLFQLSVEALKNVRKHAHAHNVTITLSSKEGEVKLLIQDDGQGFDEAAFSNRSTEEKHRHIGLYSMKERAAENGGTMAVDSAPGRGTTLEFTFALYEPVGAPTGPPTFQA